MATHVFTENCSNYPQDFEIFGDDRNKIKILAANIDGIKTDIVFCDYRFDYNSHFFLIDVTHIFEIHFVKTILF